MKYGEIRQCRLASFDRYFLEIVIVSMMAVLLASCSSGETSAFLAPPPPRLDLGAEREKISELSIEPAIGSGQGLGAQGVPGERIPESVVVAIEEENRPKGCRIQDRFDRKALLAYEWGGENRLGIDVDGLSYDSYDVEQVRIEYRLRFQPYKNNKERCRYSSSWQGMLGTGYNELFLRENDTIWQEFNVIENDIEDGWDTIFH